jgi:hypothetical protein
MNQRPSNDYLEMIKQKLDAFNTVNGKGNGHQDYTRDNFHTQFRNDDHLDIMGRAAIEYMKKKEQNNGHPPF